MKIDCINFCIFASTKELQYHEQISLIHFYTHASVE
jgi:hypothetical protein